MGWRRSGWFGAGAVAALLGLAALLPAAEKDTQKPQAEAYKELEGEFDRARDAFSKAYQEAKTDEARRAAVDEKYPRVEKYAGRFLKVAERDPKTQAALEALVWIVTNGSGVQEADKALELLLAHHVANARLADICRQLGYSPSPSAAKLLEAIRAKSPHRAAQGKALFALGMQAQGRGGASERLFEEVRQNYGDIPGEGRSKLGEEADANLFEARNLAIGKTAPDIEGEDVEGKRFRLSEYRGKVVVLDFWGDW